MLRSFFIFLSHSRWARWLVTHLPLAWRAASRFVAGHTIDEAITAIRSLNSRGIAATLDHLGESVTNEAEARRAADDYLLALDKIAAGEVRANVSLKLTQFGLDLSTAFCPQNARRVVEKARATDNFVRIDMEGTPHTDRTLEVFRALRQDFDNVGIVLQAYLYRTENDLQQLIAEKSRVRLCKGAYQEPADKAFPRKADTDANYIKLAGLMLDHARDVSGAGRNGRLPPLPALATHDEKMILAAQAHAARQPVPRENFEFQMLYGIRRDLQERLAADGYAVRVYVPYGNEWYPYCMRRLAERPANVWFILSSLFRG